MTPRAGKRSQEGSGHRKKIRSFVSSWIPDIMYLHTSCTDYNSLFNPSWNNLKSSASFYVFINIPCQKKRQLQNVMNLQQPWPECARVWCSECLDVWSRWQRGGWNLRRRPSGWWSPARSLPRWYWPSPGGMRIRHKVNGCVINLCSRNGAAKTPPSVQTHSEASRTSFLESSQQHHLDSSPEYIDAMKLERSRGRRLTDAKTRPETGT